MCSGQASPRCVTLHVNPAGKANTHLLNICSSSHPVSDLSVIGCSRSLSLPFAWDGIGTSFYLSVLESLVYMGFPSMQNEIWFSPVNLMSIEFLDQPEVPKRAEENFFLP